jgi:hypothetical protein
MLIKGSNIWLGGDASVTLDARHVRRCFQQIEMTLGLLRHEILFREREIGSYDASGRNVDVSKQQCTRAVE